MNHKFKNLHKGVRIYRDKSHKTGKTEAMEQIDAYQWVIHEYPWAKFEIMHLVNEQMGSAHYQGRLNQMGRLKGAPDLLWLRQCNGYPYALFELKRRHTGSPSNEQKDVLSHHAERGAFVCICWGAEQFKLAVKDFLQD